MPFYECKFTVLDATRSVRSPASFLPQHLLLRRPWTGHGIPDCSDIAVKCPECCPGAPAGNKTLFLSHISRRKQLKVLYKQRLLLRGTGGRPGWGRGGRTQPKKIIIKRKSRRRKQNKSSGTFILRLHSGLFVQNNVGASAGPRKAPGNVS